MFSSSRIRLLSYAILLFFALSFFAASRMKQLSSRLDSEGWILKREAVDSGAGSVVELISGKYAIDGYFQSMQGPSSNLPQFRVADAAAPEEIIWVTGIESKVVASANQTPISAEYFCHANLTLSPESTSPEAHCAAFPTPKHQDWRLFTLVPGRMKIELPPGFGIPLRASTELDLYTMSLNQNPDRPVPGDIRFLSRIHYSKSSKTIGMRPVFRRALYVYQQFRELTPVSGLPAAAGKHIGEQCAQECEKSQLAAVPSRFNGADPNHPGATCCVSNASTGGVLKQFGNDHTIHWMVPPGRHTYKSEVTDQFELPFDTTAHYVTGHLHPCGVSLELVDVESGDVIFSIDSEDFDDLIGVRRMSELRFEAGIKLEKDRRYELIAEYDNPTSKPSDAMAILYLYLAEEPDFSG
ncbi:MAG: hypothetical protein ACI8UO_005191 [Verrucomicrobiales bacterium]|jgi:hypothetical protein